MLRKVFHSCLWIFTNKPLVLVCCSLFPVLVLAINVLSLRLKLKSAAAAPLFENDQI